MDSLSWSTVSAREVLDLACRAQGITYSSMDLLRFGNTAIYLLKPDPLIARVSRPGTDLAQTDRQMRFCRWLGERGFPIVTPSSSAAPEPLAVYDAVVSFWHYLPHDPAQLADPKAFGTLMARFHAESASYEGELGEWNPMREVADRLRAIDEAGRLTVEDSETLWQWQRHLEQRLRNVDSQLGWGPLHGAAHFGNVVATDRGAILSDPEHLCTGPREWDLIPTALGPRRFGGELADFQAFAAGYGYDVTTSPAFEDLILARELSITVLRLKAELSTQIHEEGERRLRYWRRDPEAPPWRPF